MNEQNPKKPGIEFFKRSQCPVTNALEILGDKWTLVVIRDLFLDKKTYSEFQKSPEGIPTNILADRLKRLQASAIVSKTPYQEKPVRYEYRLTEKGKALGKVLQALKEWGLTYIAGTNVQLEEEYLKKHGTLPVK
ncbi:MAG: winged helix-turn-helix transcriptional regulator [Gammaproteobacteria bacterium]